MVWLRYCQGDRLSGRLAQNEGVKTWELCLKKVHIPDRFELKQHIRTHARQVMPLYGAVTSNTRDKAVLSVNATLNTILCGYNKALISEKIETCFTFVEYFTKKIFLVFNIPSSNNYLFLIYMRKKPIIGWEKRIINILQK